ncbi:MAG: hypothetical protein RSE14_01195 [Erythrobacter sp.]|jgi:hypothetical protein|uniref:hypothetical protein n=1 Tax=Erythrobacter sp. TaxID=1042 RepID=UPI002B4A89E1|nr:hypothetical protein [Erythrobacter sp.]WRH70738.1 MAG: hypothetical protein RSE14_01195 [Erythrobacter sp.]
MMKKLAALGLAAAMIASPSTASSYGVELRGHVAVSCHVTGQAPVVNVAGGVADLGVLREFCNNAAGYNLYLDYAPQLAGAVVTVDGTSIQLGSEGTAALAAEAGPAMRSRSVQIDLSEVEDASNLAIAFRIVPR